MPIPFWLIFVSPTLLGILAGMVGEMPMQTSFWTTRKVWLRRACITVSLLGIAIIGVAVSPFAWELTTGAADITVRVTFSTTFWTMLRDVAVVVYVARKISKRWGKEEVDKYLKTGIDAAEAIAVAFILTFIYHLAVTVPKEMRAAANNVTSPAIPEKIIPHLMPPPFWAVRLLPPTIKPVVTPAYAVMPLDPPYPANTVVAGINFEPRTFDVRLFLSINHAPIKNLDMKIWLINTSGQQLSVLALTQRTTFPNITITPVLNNNGSPPNSITVVGGAKGSTVPLGATSSLGTLEKYSATWRIHCDALLADVAPEFVLMVTRPHRTKMIEGFMVRGSYEYQATGKGKTAKLENITEFDDSGKPYAPSLAAAQAIIKRYPPGFEPTGGIMRFALPQPPHTESPH
jgi:hypothetical protein